MNRYTVIICDVDILYIYLIMLIDKAFIKQQQQGQGQGGGRQVEEEEQLILPLIYIGKMIIKAIHNNMSSFSMIL